MIIIRILGSDATQVSMLGEVAKTAVKKELPQEANIQVNMDIRPALRLAVKIVFLKDQHYGGRLKMVIHRIKKRYPGVEVSPKGVKKLYCV